MTEQSKVSDWPEQSFPEEEPIIVSCRKYQTVLNELRIPEDYFPLGVKVLSVGEGLSDFARELYEEKKVDVVALDPIYALGKEVINEDPKKVRTVLRQAYGDKVKFKLYPGLVFPQEKDGDKVPLPDPKRITAGSVYELPFPDQFFDLVIGSRIGEYISLAPALSELARVLRPGGEIRLSGIFTSVIISEGKLLPGKIEYDSYLGDFYFVPVKGMDRAMQWLVKKRNFSTYVILDGLPKRSEIRDGFGIYESGIMVLRKNEDLPQLEPRVSDAVFKGRDFPEGYPYLGKVLKIDPKDLETGKKWRWCSDEYYKVEF